MIKKSKYFNKFPLKLTCLFGVVFGSVSYGDSITSQKSPELSQSKSAWLEKASGSVRAYVGGTLRYYEETQKGRYNGLDLSLAYKLPANSSLGASLGMERNPDQYRDDDLNHSKNEYYISDLNLSFSMSEVAKHESSGSTVGTSVTGFYPLSRSSRAHDLYTTLSNAWSLNWAPRESYSFGIRASYSKNFYKYTEQMAEVRRGDLLGTSSY